MSLPTPRQIYMLRTWHPIWWYKRWDFGGLLSHESGTLINGITAPLKETKWRSLAHSALWYSEKTIIYEPESGPSPDTKSACDTIPDIPASRTVEVFVVYKPSSLIFYYRSWTGLRNRDNVIYRLTWRRKYICARNAFLGRW